MGVPRYDPQLKTPVVRRPEYTLFLEQATRDETFIHCDVYTWSHHVARRLKADVEALLALHGGPIRALHTPGDAKHLKFITFLGFKYVTPHTGDRQPQRHIYST